MSRWQLISFFGESAFLLPCAVFLYAWLRWHGAHAVARHWLLAFSATALAVLLSKLAFMGWGVGSQALNFTGFSGHAMMAAAILPVLACLAVPARHRTLSWLAAGAGVLLALAVGLSRLALHAHSVSEVASGLALGFCASLPFIARREVPRGPVAMLVASGALAMLLVLPIGGVAGVTHVWVEDIATFLSGRERPFQRGEWSGRRPCPGCRTLGARPLCAPSLQSG
ncbi:MULTISPECIES: phosphatase PAP2 family protein [unclassified Cupriavidus]|uniref:phosphatase PAP2 family protein n=1 Tax=unclassified Cupriavidus TaxID=2640874 RepID=UPI0028B41E1E|nr:phosphatase PAP2 family protein [Cupriavidus sp. SZY C1]MDT6963875.1 phosphatase PAP2 family protein [Cupriavidus sp. SZY C1]